MHGVAPTKQMHHEIAGMQQMACLELVYLLVCMIPIVTQGQLNQTLTNLQERAKSCRQQLQPESQHS